MLKNNVTLTLRERGKIKQRWEGQNIWLDAGREYLRDLLVYSAVSPLTTPETRRIRYIGFGIGGYRQEQLAMTENPPLSTDYPGSNTQTDLNPTVTQLQRPVRITAGVYLAELPPPVISSTFYHAKFSLTLGLTDISYGGYLAVPLSEVALYLTDATETVGTNQPVAYEACEPLVKTQSLTLDVDWAVRF